MKDTDKITMTLGQLKRLVKESTYQRVKYDARGNYIYRPKFKINDVIYWTQQPNYLYLVVSNVNPENGREGDYICKILNKDGMPKRGPNATQHFSGNIDKRPTEFKLYGHKD